MAMQLTHKRAVRPLPLAKRVDPNPLGVDPSAHFQDRGELIGVGIGSGRNEDIKASNDWLQRAFECRECGGYVSCRHTELTADVNLYFLEAGFATETANVARIRNREVAQGFGMPTARRLYGEHRPPARVIPDRLENTQ